MTIDKITNISLILFTFMIMVCSMILSLLSYININIIFICIPIMAYLVIKIEFKFIDYLFERYLK